MRWVASHSVGGMKWNPPYHIVDDLVKFLLLQLAGNMSDGAGLTEAKVQFLCKSNKGSLPAVLDSLRRDRWLPASVSNQVMSFEYDRFLKENMPPIPSGRYNPLPLMMNALY